MSQHRIRLPLVAVLLILVSAGSLIAAPRQETAVRRQAPHLFLKVLDLLPERLETWVSRHVLASPPETPEVKCSGGIDPNGKPCPPIP